MLIINYKFNNLYSLNKSPILYNFFDYDMPFFEKTKFEFVKFYNITETKAPKRHFLKSLRYKKAYHLNDFITFSRILSRHGLLLKFKTFLVNLVTEVRLDENKFDLPCFHTTSFNESSYWLYSFDLLCELQFVFKLTFHRLDKNVRKYNRKRKLKISYKYNYVPSFKRKKWLFSLISKFTKFGFYNSFYKNFSFLIFKLIDKSNNSLFHKLNYFTYRKIKNFSYQKTLIKSI